MDETVTRPGTTDRLGRLARTAAFGALGGGLAGILAGLGARVAMRIFAEVTQSSVSFSLGGTFTILVFGVLFGTALGIVYVAIRRLLHGPAAVRGAVFGLSLVVVLVAPALFNQPGEAAPNVALGFGLFAALTLGAGVAIALGVGVVERRVGAIGPGTGLLLALSLAVGLLGLAMVFVALGTVYASIFASLVR